MTGPGGNGRTPSRGSSHDASIPIPHPTSRGGNGPNDGFTVGRGFTPDEDVFEINLIFEGQLVRHRVTLAMTVVQLVIEVATVFRLNTQGGTLMLLGLVPHTLQSQSTLFGPPPVQPGSTIMIFQVGGQAFNHGAQFAALQTMQMPQAPVPNLHDGQKFLANFKLPKFDGAARSWKIWDKAFVRFLSIHQLDHVIEETFLDVLPLSPPLFTANKMVYYLLEDSIVSGSLAAKYFRQAAKWNGNEAYSRLHDGYVFSGPQTMSLLLAELVNLRFKPNESASGFCLRLREIFEDLKMVPGHSSITMIDTQKIGYLLTGIRQEKSLQAVYVSLQDKQVRGATSFEEACDDLHHRCEAIRADEFLETPVREHVPKALITTQAKRQNKEAPDVEMAKCLQKECVDMVKSYLPLCLLHYHQCISGKCSEVELKDGLGKAKFNTVTQVIDYPSTVPKNRFPLRRSARPDTTRKALVSRDWHNCLSE